MRTAAYLLSLRSDWDRVPPSPASYLLVPRLYGTGTAQRSLIYSRRWLADSVGGIHREGSRSSSDRDTYMGLSEARPRFRSEDVSPSRPSSDAPSEAKRGTAYETAYTPGSGPAKAGCGAAAPSRLTICPAERLWLRAVVTGRRGRRRLHHLLRGHALDGPRIRTDHQSALLSECWDNSGCRLWAGQMDIPERNRPMVCGRALWSWQSSQHGRCPKDPQSPQERWSQSGRGVPLPAVMTASGRTKSARLGR